MSMMEVARYLHYSRSIDHVRLDAQVMNLSVARSGRLFWYLQVSRGAHLARGYEERTGVDRN